MAWHDRPQTGQSQCYGRGLDVGCDDLVAGGAEDEEEEDDDLMPWAEGLLPAHLKAREDVVQQGRITFARRNGAATAEASITCRWSAYAHAEAKRWCRCERGAAGAEEQPAWAGLRPHEGRAGVRGATDGRYALTTRQQHRRQAVDE